MIIDKLIEKTAQLKNPTCVGMDTSFDYLPDDMKKNCKNLADAAKAITEFNYKIIDKIYDVVPSVKVQIAYYEMYGVAGLQAFYDTINYSKQKGLIVISDVKRNDIGSTAGCYSSAYLGETKINDKSFLAFPSDFVTVNGYLGSDGIVPFVNDCKKYDKGIFVLVKTSNHSSNELQDKKFENGDALYYAMAGNTASWGKDLIGKYGYSSVGAVVGATYKEQAETLRNSYKNLFFLIPGYGTQGGTGADITVCFDSNGRGGIVNSSRGILCAYKADKYKALSYYDAARRAAEDMQADLSGELKKAGKEIK